jgi:dolichol-phosphate mannosyltransferase
MPQPSPKRVLVTGAGGFVGAQLAYTLAEAGHRVFATVRPGEESWRLAQGDGFEVLPVDLERAEDVHAAVAASSPQWILHLAAHGAYSWQTDRERILSTNVRTTMRLLDEAVAHGVEAFVHAGTSSEYGSKDHAPHETEAPEPNSDYAVTKTAATLYCAHVARSTGLHAVTLRLYSVYGPWEEPGRLVPTLLARALEGGLPPLVAPSTVRDFVYVGDVCDAFVAAAARTDLPLGSIINIGSGRETTLREIVDVVRELLSVAAEPEWGTHGGRAWDTSVWVADPSLAATRVGWQARTNLREGLAATVDWLLANPRLWAHYELDARAAQSWQARC